MNLIIEFLVDGLITGSAEAASDTHISKTKRLIASILLLCVFALIIAFFVFVVITVTKKYLFLSIVLAVLFGSGTIWYFVAFIRACRRKAGVKTK